MNDKELADDVIRTVNSLLKKMETARPDDAENQGVAAQMGMDPLDMIDMFKPKLRQTVMGKPDKSLEAVAVVYKATEDIMEKHADEDPETLAARGMENAGE